MKKEMPFGRNDHVRAVKMIAEGLHHAKKLDNYLEFGIRQGPCFNAVAPLAKTAYAVDIKNCRKGINHNKNLKWFQCKTIDFWSMIPGDVMFDLTFIDADHSHKASMKDFELVAARTKQNGLILLHDTYPPDKRFLSSGYCNDTYKTADRIRKIYSKNFEIVTLPFYFGVSVVRKLDRQVEWIA